MSASLAHLLEATADRRPDDVAITFGDDSISFAQLEEHASRIAAGLQSIGVQDGDRVALWLPNHPAFAAAMYGAWRAGAVVVPVHSALTQPEARHILADSGAKAVFCSAVQEGAARSIADELVSLQHVITAGEEGLYVPPGSQGGPPAIPAASADDIALIAYTAGTSGVPKGAVLTHGNLRANINQMRETPMAFGPDDVVLCVLPLFHIFGLNVVLNLSIAVGARMVLTERFDPAGSMELLRKELVTVIAGAPPVYVAWLAVEESPADAFSNVRVAVSGAAPLPREVLEAFRQRFALTIWEGYGLTETAPALTSTSIGGVAKPACVGRPLPGVELRLLDENGDEAEDGDPGEIVVRGPNVFGGYWQRPDETEASIVDGWFHTGDVGVLDDDGDLYIVDRRRDLVLVSGFNVYPREVEDVLRRHQNVGDCAVVGAPDQMTGEAVRALVVPDPPGSVTSEALVEFCGESLAPYKIPREIELVTEIPRNAAGKVLRRELRTG